MPKQAAEPKNLEYIMIYLDQIEQWIENKLTRAQMGDLIVLAYEYARTNVISNNVPDALKWPYGNLVREINSTHKKIISKSEKAQEAAYSRWGKKTKRPKKTSVYVEQLTDDSQEEQSDEEELEDEEDTSSVDHIRESCKKELDNIKTAFHSIYFKRYPLPELKTNATQEECQKWLDAEMKEEKCFQGFDMHCIKVDWKKEWLSTMGENETFTIHLDINGRIYPQTEFEDAINDYLNNYAFA